MSAEHKPIVVAAPASRIRLSKTVLEELSLDSSLGDFGAVGYFRSEGELLIFPDEGLDEPKVIGARLLDGMNALTDEERFDRLQIPAARTLVAASRVFPFRCSWTTTRTQLDLNLGKAVTARLGLPEQGRVLLYPYVWRGTLVIMNESAHQRAWNTDIYNDLLAAGDGAEGVWS